jgi:Ca2+-transporting ATPase
MYEGIIKPWAESADEVLEYVHSSAAGITESDSDLRRRRTGENSLPSATRFSATAILARQFASPLIFILVIALTLATILSEWINATVILLAIFVNSGLGFYQEYRAESTLERLQTYIKDRARVIRAGVESEIDSQLLVPGDVVRLTYGARVPADVRLLEANDLAIDESVLTGESMPRDKTSEPLSEGTALPERTNMAYAGTLITEGYAMAVVVATGGNTEIGKIAALVTGMHREHTPLQRALSKLGWYIFAGVSLLVSIIFFVGLAHGEPLVEMLLLAVAISVGAIPEALPIALTVILAVGVERLAGRKGVMRQLAAAETLGSTTVVMTDKTGTLTEANMKLVDILTLEELLATHRPRAAITELSATERSILGHALLSAEVLIENHGPRHAVRFRGRAIETAIARAAHEHGFDVAAAMRDRQAILPFNSTNKFSITAGKSQKMHFAIGAPDILLVRSKITKDDFLAVEKTIHEISSEGKRLLGVARLQSDFLLTKTGAQNVSRLEFLGVLVFEDPIRPEAKQAIQRIERLGAKVVMITGDLRGTAMALARQLDWAVHDGQVLSGDEVRGLSDDELQSALPHIKIFARVTPEDKLRIGRLYQKSGEIVAMTGDGVNDAPSLKAMDIGIALGSGTDVAKSVAGLVLLDDNFKTIVLAIEEGRRILANIRKVFVYLTSTSLDAVALIGGSLLFGLPLPLSALQIIWVNFFTDSMPALSFAFDKEYDAGKPRARGTEILTPEVVMLTVGIGFGTSFLLFGLYWMLLNVGVDVADARSTIFVCFALYALVVTFTLKSLREPLFSYPVFANTSLNYSVLFGIMLIIATVTVPFLKDIFDLTTPPVPLLSIVLLWLVFNVAIVEAAKWWFRRLV